MFPVTNPDGSPDYAKASFAKELLDHMEEKGGGHDAGAPSVRCPHCQQGHFGAAEMEGHYERCVQHVNKFKCGYCDSRFRYMHVLIS